MTSFELCSLDYVSIIPAQHRMHKKVPLADARSNGAAISDIHEPRLFPDPDIIAAAAATFDVIPFADHKLRNDKDLLLHVAKVCHPTFVGDEPCWKDSHDVF